jgi:Fe2+ transport system protein FeoA
MTFGFHFRHRCVRGAGPHPDVLQLADGYEGHAYRIVTNPDRQSREMGFFPGMEVCVLRNVGGEHGLVIGAGSTRYVVARTAAAAICVAPVGASPS